MVVVNSLYNRKSSKIFFPKSCKAVEENLRNYSIDTDILVYNRDRTIKLMKKSIFYRKSEENDDVRKARFDKITW